mmetsp:Transcript_63242/g.131570  ORF Transcript_63242/g.131570 Transcript_63242/m.131570 type:complete len:395 (-) Transcript_63242:85-1269(-)|eukprot:CAMPEP_0181305334 /NCGR_PEP_ID=MMETSP1101-20121128/9669_1 /TAXON_ID=46948 /ORGANISM="Rhodomonas abbreviata, Strain Caron Lab Isolate" /LENGTH=394 /DNA_ID=CAMNT_0023411233 /DNA_START=261 /DNA_END=1445 /DNA_ORIENTATION=+
MFAFTKVFGVTCLLALAESFSLSPSFASPRLNTAVARSGQRPAALSTLSMNVRKAVDEGAWFADMSARKNLDQLYKNNEKWMETMTKNDADYFKNMAGGQAPKFLWVGCSDARVPANELVGLGAGELFVHRNVANQVVGTDISLMSILQFSLEFLEVENIIICGHYACGGVAASMANNDHHAPLENWIRQIKDVYRLHSDELDAISDPDARQRRLVELNVVEQCNNVYKEAVVQRRRIWTEEKQGDAKPRIFGMVYDPNDGLLKRVDWSPEKNMDYDFYKIYDADAVKDKLEDTYTKRPSSWREKDVLNQKFESMRLSGDAVEAAKPVASEAEDMKVSEMAVKYKQAAERLQKETAMRIEQEKQLKSVIAELEEIKKALKDSGKGTSMLDRFFK